MSSIGSKIQLSTGGLPDAQDSPLYYLLSLYGLLVVLLHFFHIHAITWFVCKNVPGAFKKLLGMITDKSVSFLALSILHILWTVGLVLNILLIQKLSPSAYIGNVISVNQICFILFFRLMLAQLNLTKVPVDFEVMVTCLFKIPPALMHSILMIISFALTSAYGFINTSTMQCVAVSFVLVAHLSCHIAIHFAIDQFRSSILELKTGSVISVLESVTSQFPFSINILDGTIDQLNSETGNVMSALESLIDHSHYLKTVIEFLLYAVEHQITGTENHQNYLKFLFHILEKFLKERRLLQSTESEDALALSMESEDVKALPTYFEKAHACQLIVLIIHYLRKSEDFKMKLLEREYQDIVLTARATYKAEGQDSDAIRQTVDMLERELAKLTPFAPLTVALELLDEISMSTSFANSDFNKFKAASLRVDFTLRNIKIVENEDENFANYLRTASCIVQALQQEFTVALQSAAPIKLELKSAVQISILIILFAIGRVGDFKDKLRKYSDAVLSAQMTLTELEITLNPGARVTLAMLKDEMNQLCRDILDQDCKMIDDLLAVYDHRRPPAKRSGIDGVRVRVREDVKFVHSNVDFIDQRPYLRSAMYFLEPQRVNDLEGYRDILHFVAFILTCVRIAYEWDGRRRKYTVNVNLNRDTILKLKPPPGTRESDDFDHTLQLLEHESRKIEVSEQIEVDELAKVRGKKV